MPVPRHLAERGMTQEEYEWRLALRRCHDRFDKDGMQTTFTVGNVWSDSPTFFPETREERIARLEARGSLDPNCPGCREFYEHPTLSPFAPSHNPLSTCGSGKRPHCTCPRCWG